MAKITIPITNGEGSANINNGSYNVTSNTIGYASIDPETVEITEGLDSYEFTVSATGTLTIHVSDDGTDVGVPIVGATFQRTDADGTGRYGEIQESNDDGQVTFANVPYSEENAPNIYIVQLSSDEQHTFSSETITINMTESEYTYELENPEAVSRDFKLTDVNYEGLKIEDGEIELNTEE